MNTLIIIGAILSLLLGASTFLTALIIWCGKKGIFISQVKSGEIILTKKGEKFDRAIGNGTEFWVEAESGEVNLTTEQNPEPVATQPKDFLGLYWVGWWPFYRIHNYEFEWEKAHLEEHESRIEIINSVRFRAGYPIVIRDTETSDQVRIGMNLIATVRITNVKKLLASYKSNWFVNLREVIVDEIRRTVSKKKLEEVYGIEISTINFPGVIVELLKISDIIVPPEIATAREAASAAKAKFEETRTNAAGRLIDGETTNKIEADKKRRDGETTNAVALDKARVDAKAAPLRARAKTLDLKADADMKNYELSRKLKAIGNNIEAATLVLETELGKDWAKALQTNQALHTLVMGENPGLHRLFHITPEAGRQPEKKAVQTMSEQAEKPSKKEGGGTPEAGKKPEEGAPAEGRVE